MDDIARELGISKKTLYQWVENKEDLLQRVIEHRHCREEADMERMRAEAHDAMDALIRMGRYGAKAFGEVSPNFLFDVQKYYPKLWHGIDRENQEFFVARMEQNLERGMAERLYRSDLHPGIIARLFVHMLTGLFMFEDRLLTNPQDNLVQIFNQMLLYHIYGIATDKGRELIKDYLAEEERAGGYFRPQS